MARRRPWLKFWLVFSVAILTASLYSGYRASVAANVPQYLFTKTHVMVEEPVVPENDVEAELEAQLSEEGQPRTTAIARPMVVLGLADAAGPAVVVSGIVLWLWGRRSATPSEEEDLDAGAGSR